MTGFPRTNLGTGGSSGAAPVNIDQFKLNPVQYFGTRKVFHLGTEALGGYNADFTFQGITLYSHVSNRSLANYGLSNDPDAYKFVIGGGTAVNGYYLPWAADSAYLLELGGEADYFLTAQINGCCFVANGTRTNPTVVHANCNGQVGEGDGLDTRVAKYKRGYLNFTSQLIRDGYIDDDQPTTILDPEMYSGCGRVVVFGIRRGGDWTFYATLNGSTQGKTIEIWPNCPRGILPQPP